MPDRRLPGDHLLATRRPMLSAESLIAQSLLMASEMTKVKTQKRRNWTCKKCGGKFHPHLSKSLCNACIKERDGEL